MVAMAFLLDLGQCIGCQACVAACKLGNELAENQQHIHLIEQTRGVFPELSGGFKNHRCYHCADAACVSVCPTGSLYKEDGLTRLDQTTCSGCSYCVEACPYEVPVMIEGRSSKCDGCASVVSAGGDPWCVKTCPSSALAYGTRDEVLGEAERRASALRARYPNSRVYGETEAGGLGVVMVLPDDPERLDLPTDPSPPVIATAWQNVVQPGAIGLTVGTAVVAGLAAVIARRNHMKELEQMAADGPSPAADSSTTGEET